MLSLAVALRCKAPV